MSDAKEYISKREIPQLFECLMTALMYHRPGDHLGFIQECIEKVKVHGISSVRWDLFLEEGGGKAAKAPLPPVTTPGSSRASSRAASRAELVEKKPPLPPITTAAAAAPTTTAPPRPTPPPPAPAPLTPPSCPVVLVIGGPGSGGRALSRVAADRYGFHAVSIGDLAGGPEASEPPADDFLAPDPVALELLIGALGRLPADCRGVFIEGYPRSEAQLEDYLEKVQRVDHALLLDFEEATLRGRLERRLSPAKAAAQLDAFRSDTLPVCRYLDDEGKLLLLPIDGEPDGEDGGDSVAAQATELLDSALTPLANLAVVVDAGVAVGVAASPPPTPPPTTTTTEAVPAAPHPTGPLLYIRSISLDMESAANERDTDLPDCPVVLVLGGPGSRRSALTRRLVDGYAGFVRVDARDAAGKGEDEDQPDGPVDADALCGLLRERVAAASAPVKCILLEGHPASEAGLRDFFARLGRPDLALLVDCRETDMLGRLLAAGGQPKAVGARMRQFREETLPVVRHLDEAGLLCVIPGDRDEDAVLEDLKAVIDFVFFNVTRTDASRNLQSDPAVTAARSAVVDAAAKEPSAPGTAGKEAVTDEARQ